MSVIVGDCIEVMRGMPDESIDAIVSDPPYGLGFMGKAWDELPPGEEWARECLRVLKPGGHLLAFGGSRTYHRLACAVEDAGFEVRDQMMWLYGSGFPKSLDVSKAIDKAAGAERTERIGPVYRVPNAATVNPHFINVAGARADGPTEIEYSRTAPATPAAQLWQGWGTALKPAHEPIVVARKPLIGTVAQNVLAHGTGAINVDGCRVGSDGGCAGAGAGAVVFGDGLNGTFAQPVPGLGRWPANVILDEEAAAMLDEQSGTQRDGVAVNRNRTERGAQGSHTPIVPGTLPGPDIGYGGAGGASRFFYCAKASSRERNAGLGHLPERHVHRYGAGIGEGKDPAAPSIDRNVHPTVKPIALMRYLVRLVTPPGGTVLDPFLGSGTTGIAAALEGFSFVGIEREPEYADIARARIAHWSAQPQQMELAA